ncbi:pitrilysin family protein [Streptomyces sp. NBC_00078]|uniref:M16 family metallopeptidase n=1 Tax=unclassified Streptomyces TaxID=2593676 RepID=UPI002254334E|nr:pitrilysin family protein [Streptomyces sp. NBC_00078]MCX5422396.1 insulinase family protein [Streptomyces sp. NBC_00078]
MVGFVLDNGLRVLLLPDRNTPAVGVALRYDVGFRSEPAHHAGLAHLFEHMMFQGSGNYGPSEHARLIQAAGGGCDANTRQDCTVYHSVLPPAALELVLSLEADRMRGPRITRENLENQARVIREEHVIHVAGRPYGAFPWMLPGALFPDSENTRGGYDIDGLGTIGIPECTEFFSSYYAPGNAVLTVAGGFDPAEASTLVRRHFEPVPGGTGSAGAPAGPPPYERGVREAADVRDVRVVDRWASLPAVAVGYRLPDPAVELDACVDHLTLVAVLGQGRAGRLRRRLLGGAGLAVDVSMASGLFGVPFDARHPDLVTCLAVHTARTDAGELVAAIDDEVRAVARGAVGDEELARITARWTAQFHRGFADAGARSRAAGGAELLHGDGTLALRLPALVGSVTPGRIAAAAERMRAAGRAVAVIEPAAQPQRAGART